LSSRRAARLCSPKDPANARPLQTSFQCRPCDALELEMQLCRSTPRLFEKRRIEQKGAAVGEWAEVPVLLSPA
jgi:hypothetical protein